MDAKIFPLGRSKTWGTSVCPSLNRIKPVWSRKSLVLGEKREEKEEKKEEIGTAGGKRGSNVE